MKSTFGSLENARAVISELVERYRENRDRYESSAYNEETARNEFINPLFEALGWDIANKSGAAEQYKDVIHEESIKVGDYTKAPDYTFRFGGVRKFFVEAKKPFIDLKSDPDPAYQLRRYAWSAKLPLSILTDFEGLAVYDTRIKPRVGDKASIGRILYLTFEELLPKLKDIWSIFSKDAVLKGSFDRYAEATLGKRGTSEVDAEFLKDIEGWREELAKNLAQRNEDLTEDDLNFAVQTTIDRIIFMRIAEGRGAEGYGGLLALTNGPHIYKRLVELYRKADHRYNSGLFDFSADGDRLTPGLTIDDKVLKPILADLYYPQSPYEFSVLPAEILGNVYEQFLGKVIRLTKGHRAVIEEKPEVKKAGGVYYTPSYIVEYIVGQTVGTLTEGKSPKQMEKLRILDPACGSGSFLIVAYSSRLRTRIGPGAGSGCGTRGRRSEPRRGRESSVA
jgi:N-6 DNA Methylase